MALNPLLDLFNILLAVLEILVNRLGVAVKKARLWSFSGFDGHGPTSVLNICGEVTWEGICIGSGKIHVLRAGRGVERVEWVLFLY